MPIEEVILVNEKDEEIGLCEKMKAHKEGKLHRAFSIFIFNAKGELLLQRRALNKYHTPGLWTNTCCSHPRKGEVVKKAAIRRLKEEMGINLLEEELTEKFTFLYKAKLGDIYEHELDHVLVAMKEVQPVVNEKEVCDYKWESYENIMEDIKKNPEKYTYWFKEIMKFMKKKF